jgi:hypothetical protein
MKTLITDLCKCPIPPNRISVVKYTAKKINIEKDLNCYKDFILALAISKSCSPLERC